jgi:hypothetical protein
MRTARTRRRAVFRTAVFITTAALGAALAPAAFADDPGAIQIGAVTYFTTQRDSFIVPVTSTDPADPVASVTAVIRDGDTQVGDPITLMDSPNSPGDWVLPKSALLKLTEDGGRMPHLGTYTIGVTATGARGDSVTVADDGPLDFTMRPLFTATPVSDPATVDYLHRDVTVSGTLVGVQPGSDDQVPLAGRDVSVEEVPVGGSGPSVTLHAVTDADGHYAVHAHLDTLPVFHARFTESSTEVNGSTQTSMEPHSTTTVVTITGTADKTWVRPGSTLTFSGYARVGYRAPATAPAAAGVAVRLVCYNDAGGIGSQTPAVTDATGHYRITAVADPVCASAWRVVADTGFVSSLADGSSAYIPVDIPDVAAFSGVSAAIAADHTVTVTGHLTGMYRPLWSYFGENTFLWYSADGKTKWQRLRGANTGDDHAFKLVTAGYSDGFYQVRHTDTYDLLAASSPVIHLSRTQTRIVTVRASATKAKAKSVITVSGVLQQYTAGAWKPLGGQPVRLYFRPRGKTAWTYVLGGKSGSNGAITTLRPRVTADGDWLIRYWGDSTHYNSLQTWVYVDVV